MDRRIFELPGVEEQPSAITVPGARFGSPKTFMRGLFGAFMIRREFASVPRF